MGEVVYGDPCKIDSDCPTNVCETMYDQAGNPKGRFCVGTESEYGRNCATNKDCESGECLPIYNNDSQMIGKRCKGSGEVKRDQSFFFKDKSVKYGLINDAARDGLFASMDAGPIAKFIAIVLEAIIIVIKMVVNLLKDIFMIVFEIIGNIFLGKVKGDMFFGLINNKHKENGICMSLWVPRTIITILLPPFGVYMSRGINGLKYVIICALLTCVFYFPGLIYAFIVMGNSKIAEEEAKFMAEKKGKNIENIRKRLAERRRDFQV